MHTSNLIAYVVPVFTLMILCEFIYGYLKKKNNLTKELFSRKYKPRVVKPKKGKGSFKREKK